MTVRRQVLLGMVSTLLALVGFRSPVVASTNVAVGQPLGRRLAAVFPHAENAAGLGQAIIRSSIAPGLDRQGLQNRLATACATIKSLDDVNDDVLRCAIRDIVAEDFAAERMIAVDGWRLAEAEAAIYRVIAEDRGVIA